MQEGDFEMKHINRLSSQSFNVAIAPFSLSILGDDDSLWILRSELWHPLRKAGEFHKQNSTFYLLYSASKLSVQSISDFGE